MDIYSRIWAVFGEGGGSGAGSPFHLCCHSSSLTRLTQRLGLRIWGSKTPCVASLYQDRTEMGRKAESAQLGKEKEIICKNHSRGGKKEEREM